MRRLALVIIAFAAIGISGPAGAAEADTRADRHERPARDRIALECRAVRERPRLVVHCRWSGVDHPDFKAYRLVRIGGGATQRATVFQTRDPATTSATDRRVEADARYAYAVVVVGPHASVLGVSNVSSVHT